MDLLALGIVKQDKMYVPLLTNGTIASYYLQQYPTKTLKRVRSFYLLRNGKYLPAQDIWTDDLGNRIYIGIPPMRKLVKENTQYITDDEESTLTIRNLYSVCLPEHGRIAL